MKKLIVILFILTIPKITMAGLGLGVASLLENEEIDESIRQEIHQLNSKIIDAINLKDKDRIMSLYMAEYRDNKELSNIFDSVLDFLVPIVRNNEPKIFNEYYWSRKGIGRGTCIIPSHTDAGDKFVISLEGKSNKAFVSLLTLETALKEYVLSFVYMKEDGEWRLYSLRSGVLKIAGKYVMDWYRDSKALYEKDFLIPALIRLYAIKKILRPAPYFQFQEEENIISLLNEIQDKTSKEYRFPMHLMKVENNPTIYFIQPNFMNNKFVPLVKYVTGFSIDDVENIKKEAHLMHSNFIELFPGITHGVEHILYQAFVEPPTDPKKLYKAYGVAVDVKN